MVPLSRRWLRGDLSQPNAGRTTGVPDHVLAQLGEDAARAFAYLGITAQQSERALASVGEARVLQYAGVNAGYVWIEKQEDILHIHGVIVRPEHRNRGMGATLFAQLSDEFRNGISSMKLGVQSSNDAAQRFYRRQGFICEADLPEAGVVVMRKRMG